MKFDIPINISVESTTEKKAEQQVFDFLIKAAKEFGIEYRVTDFEYFEFIIKEPSHFGCRDFNISEGEQSCSKESSCHCSKQSCC